jgi:hypothetical protein
MNSRCVLAAALALFLCAPPVQSAVTSTIAVQGSISGGGTSVLTKPGNTKDGASDPFVLKSFGDESIASATLLGTTGSLTESAHACSGPPIGNPAGSGNASTRATVNYFETFTIVSDSLPPGTPVTINLKVAAARSYRATVIQPEPIQAGDAAVNMSAFIGFNTELSSGHFSGGVGAQQIATGDVFRNPTGIFANPLRNPAQDGDPDAMESTAVLAATVGGHFSFNVETETDATSAAIFPITTDGDDQMSLNWGADVVAAGGQARLQTSDGTGQFPGANSAGSDRALADLPPAPMDAPEPAALALLAAPLTSLLLRRRSAPR